MIICKCQYCQADIRADDSHAGQVVNCPSCKRPVKLRAAVQSHPTSSPAHSPPPTPVRSHEPKHVPSLPQSLPQAKPSPSGDPAKINCHECGAMVLPKVAERTGGLCIPCATKSGSDAAYSSTLQTHEPKQLLAEQEDPSPYSGHRQHTSGISEYQGKIIVLLLAIGLGAPLVGWLKPIPKWEYKVIAPADSQLDETMQKMGADGWELVSTRRAGSQYSMSYEMILKRPKRW